MVIVKAAKAAGGVFWHKRKPSNVTWPVCHISDNSMLYIRILYNILEGEHLHYGKNGYYMASSGRVTWLDLFSAMAKALAKRKLIPSEEPASARNADLEKMAVGIGCLKEVVVAHLSGSCKLMPEHGAHIGWKARYPAKHILESADDEVELILGNLTSCEGTKTEDGNCEE
ncbi:hypothetical protein VTL71DRAFT_1940 [Oculimacula yallundae]|uniref:Uncharacterized protein n=1 Tax=Oculimacula yallundae TaxID=86028 RepID=A0ABR4CC67_9HELO